MYETVLWVQLTLVFANGGAPINNPPRTEGSYATVEQCYEAFKQVEARAQKVVDSEPFLKGIDIQWGCIEVEVKGQDL